MGPTKNTAITSTKPSKETATVMELIPTASNAPLIHANGFRNTFKTWALNQNPPIDNFLVDRYVDHALAGLDKHYRRDDLFQQRAELAERYCAFAMGDNNE